MRLRTIFVTPLLLALLAHAQTMPATSPTTAPATAPSRVPVPDEDAQDRSRLMIITLFKDDFAKTALPARQALAKRLLSEAAGTKDDPTAHYVLLQESLELAAVASDPETAYSAASEIARLYLVDGMSLKKAALFRSNNSDATPQASEAVARFALETADKAALADDFNSVQQLVNLADTAGNRTRKVAFVASMQVHLGELRGLVADYPKIQKTLEHLKSAPNDADAQLLVGRFYALRKGQWAIGLPHLAAGSDEKLRTLAKQDLANPTDGLQQAVLGDAWWDYAQTTTGGVRTHIQDRAGEWYRLAKPNLAGLTLTRIESRIGNGSTSPALPDVPANAAVVSLLPLVDTVKDTVDGKWAFLDNTLQCTTATRNACLAIPYVPPDEYDLRVTFARTDGEGPLTILLTAHGKSFDFALDVKGEARFERVANKIAKDNPTAAPVVVANNHRYTLTLQVHKDAIRALLDDKPVTQWKTDYKDLGRYAIWRLPDEKLCALGVNNAKAIFYSIELIELAGKGRPTR
jgi:hypothetical protein